MVILYVLFQNHVDSYPNYGNIYGARDKLLSLFKNMTAKREEMNECECGTGVETVFYQCERFFYDTYYII